MRYFIYLSFDGTQYHGWQIQNNARSVQHEISHSVSVLLKQAVQVTGCGRTDTGVHAAMFVAHFDCPEAIGNTDDFAYRLNALLPRDIRIFGLRRVKDLAHSRFSAVKRTYKYYYVSSRNPFRIHFTQVIQGKPNIDAMNEACKFLLGNKNFSSFSKAHTQVKTFICNVSEAYWEKQGEELIFTITADRFLRNMVRAIVGTLIEVGLNKISPADFLNIIKGGKRAEAGASVAARGLFLHDIEYPADIYL